MAPGRRSAAGHRRPVDRAARAGHRFVGYLQDHDQVGNRAAGDRIAARLSPELLKVAAGLVLTAPFTPMLFMGEEWGARTPWQYFTDHQDAGLGVAVATGRRADFARHGWGGEVPDPQGEATFERSRLHWADLDEPAHRDMLAWYRRLIALRRQEPELTCPDLNRIEARSDETGRWLIVQRGRLRVAANLGLRSERLPLGAACGPGARLLGCGRCRGGWHCPLARCLLRCHPRLSPGPARRVAIV